MSKRKRKKLKLRNVPKSKIKGGGTKKVCLPKAKVDKMSAEEKRKVINAKKMLRQEVSIDVVLKVM